jgi:hypothetical protein
MRIVGVSGVAQAGLFVNSAATANGQIDTRAHRIRERQRRSPTTGEICACLPTIGPLIRCQDAQQ